MDILVRVPKKEVEHFWDDVPENATHEFWKLGRVPRKLLVGDCIWFQIEDHVVAKAIVDKKTYNEAEICLSTGRLWNGCLVYWKVNTFERVIPRPGKALTRGFMYVDYRRSDS